jgi:hypothetical protein
MRVQMETFADPAFTTGTFGAGTTGTHGRTLDSVSPKRMQE